MSEEAINPAGTFQQLTVTTAAQGLPNIPARATRAVITVETDNVRWRDDGTAPTSTVGNFVIATQSFELKSSGSIAAFQVIKDANASGTPILDIAYYQKSQ
jgi:hypothetical protein